MSRGRAQMDVEYLVKYALIALVIIGGIVALTMLATKGTGAITKFFGGP